MTRLRSELSGVRIPVDRHLHPAPRMKIGWSHLFQSSIESACIAFKRASCREGVGKVASCCIAQFRDITRLE